MEVLRGSRAQGAQLSPTVLMILYDEALGVFGYDAT